jgi:hypothetical protein
MTLLHSFDAAPEEPVGLRLSRAEPATPENRFRYSGKPGIVALQGLQSFYLITRKHHQRF